MRDTGARGNEGQREQLSPGRAGSRAERMAEPRQGRAGHRTARMAEPRQGRAQDNEDG